jgi:hypothetical protein
VNPQFAAKITMIVSRYGELAAVRLLPMRGGPSHSTAAGIYVLYEDGRPVHVGRTRNLRKRLQGHCSESHYHASYAFKRARAETGKRADYKPGNSRKVLAVAPDFRPAFLRQVQAIRQMQYRFLPVADPVEQYLLELYAAMELGTSMDEFDTH